MQEWIELMQIPENVDEADSSIDDDLRRWFDSQVGLLDALIKSK